MLLRTLGLLAGVVGASYLLANASWQVVLSAFMFAGVGYLLFQVRRAYIRRTKVRELWRRSRELDRLLDEMEVDAAYYHFIEQPPTTTPKQIANDTGDSARSNKVCLFPMTKFVGDNTEASTGDEQEDSKAVALG